jgi:hypothetical protein
MTSPGNLWLRLEFDFDHANRLIAKVFERVGVSGTPDYIACVVPHLAALAIGQGAFFMYIGQVYNHTGGVGMHWHFLVWCVISTSDPHLVIVNLDFVGLGMAQGRVLRPTTTEYENSKAEYERSS